MPFDISRNPKPPFVSSLPSSAADGQEIYYQSTTAGTGGGTSDSMATVGAAWLLRYRAASSSNYKWEVIGGPPIFVSGSGTTTSSTTAWGATGPQITTPLAGDYQVEHVSGVFNSTAADYCWTSISIGGSTAASNSNTALSHVYGTNKWSPLVRTVKITSVGTGVVVQMVHQVSSGTGNWDYRSLVLTPIRLGAS